MRTSIKRADWDIPRAYPYVAYLLEDPGFVVLFSGFRRGVVLAAGNSIHSIGDEGRNWAEDSWSPLDGSITLSNA